MSPPTSSSRTTSQTMDLDGRLGYEAEGMVGESAIDIVEANSSPISDATNLSAGESSSWRAQCVLAALLALLALWSDSCSL